MWSESDAEISYDWSFPTYFRVSLYSAKFFDNKQSDPQDFKLDRSWETGIADLDIVVFSFKSLTHPPFLQVQSSYQHLDSTPAVNHPDVYTEQFGCE